MQYRTFPVLDTNGRALQNVSVYVYQENTLTQVGVFDEDNAPLTQPLKTNSKGIVGFRAPNGTYDVRGVINGREDTIENAQFIDLDDILRDPYSDRAAFIAATTSSEFATASWISNGRVIQVVRDASGTIIQSDGTRWSPAGDVYPDHWAENTTPGTTDMQSATQAAIDYLEGMGGGTLRLCEAYHFASSVNVNASDIHVDARGAKITADGTLGDETQNEPDGVFNFIGSQSASTILSADASEAATTISVTNASGIVAGQAIRLYNAQSQVGLKWYTEGGTDVFRSFITRVIDVSGTTITLADPLPFSFDATTYTCVVITWDGLKRCSVIGGDWDGGGYDHPLSNGIGTAMVYGRYCQDLKVKPDTVRGFSGAQVWLDFTYSLDFDCTSMEGHRDNYADPIVEGTNAGFYGLRMDDCAKAIVGSYHANRTRHAIDGTRTNDVTTGDITATNSHRPAFGSHNGCDNWRHGHLISRGPSGGMNWRGFNMGFASLAVDCPNDSEPAFYDTVGAAGDLKRSYDIGPINSNMARESIRLEADIDTCIIRGGYHKGARESSAYSVIKVNTPRMKSFQMLGGVVEGPTARLIDFATGATERDSIVFNATEFRDYTTSAIRCQAVDGSTSLVVSSAYFAPNGGTDHVDANGTFEHLRRDGFIQGGAHYQPDNEGSFSPTLGDGTNNCTVNSGATLGYWRRDGDRVTLSGEVRLTSIASASGNIVLGNLPFNIATDGGGVITWANAFNSSTSTGIKLRALAGGTNMSLFHDSTGNDDNVREGDLTDTTRFNFIATYTTND